MVHYNQDQAPALGHDEQPYPTQSNPPLVSQQQTQAYYQGQGVAYVAPPPPIGYPTRDGPAGLHQQHAANNNIPVETNTRGEGFWKGCVAALCCCWVLDFCVC